MMYTIVPPEVLLYTEPQPAAPAACSTCAWGGRYLEVSHTPQGTMVNRLISTNPADYLNPALQPGAMIRKR